MAWGRRQAKKLICYTTPGGPFTEMVTDAPPPPNQLQEDKNQVLSFGSQYIP